MFLDINRTIRGIPAVLIVRLVTQYRLVNTCFRGREKNLAGNFSAWNNEYDLFRTNPHVIESLFKDADEALALDWSTNSISVEFAMPIGWSGTDDIRSYDEGDLERFNPNRKSSAFRVMTERKDLLAPKTNTLTIVYEVREERGQIAIIVHSLYPGKDIGELVGDISAKENCVFFDWNHPGAL